MITDLLESFGPDADGLLRAISQHVDDDALESISIADCGEDTEKHLAALKQIRDTGKLPTPMSWVPAEVLELIRWSEPENENWKPGRTGVIGHWMRAFSCAALLRATCEPWSYGVGPGHDSTLVQLIASLDTLPVDLTLPGVQFLAWLLLHSDPSGINPEVCAYAVGLFWLALKNRNRYPDELLIACASWAIQRANQLYESPASARRRAHARANGLPSEIGDGLREMVLHCQEQGAWEALAVEFLRLDLTSRNPDLWRLTTEVGDHLLA